MEKQDLNEEIEINKGIGLKSEEKVSRAEKRIRKALEIFSYNKEEGFQKILFQKNFSSIFMVKRPKVFKNLKNGSFLVFGEAFPEKSL